MKLKQNLNITRRSDFCNAKDARELNDLQPFSKVVSFSYSFNIFPRPLYKYEALEV